MVFLLFLGAATEAIGQTVEIEEVLTLGSSDAFFFSVADVKVAPDGSIYVADKLGFAVSKYDAKGNLLRRVGRRGQGPGEFAGGPVHLALLNGDVLVSDLMTYQTTHRFDADLNYIERLQMVNPNDMDVGADGNIYISSPEFLSEHADQYVSVYSPEGILKTTFSIEGLSKYVIENMFMVLASHPDKVILVFLNINRIDIRSTSGALLRQLSISDLPNKYEGTTFDLPGASKLTGIVARVAQAGLYAPGGIIFPSAALDARGHIFVQGGQKGGEEPNRTVYVMDFTGHVKTSFTLPQGALLMHIDRNGYLYTREEERSKVRKYKINYIGF